MIHDLLAHLAKEMTDLHKQKQVEMKRFLAWVKSELLAEVVGVNNLSGKTYLSSCHEQPLERLAEVLGKNNRQLRISPEMAAALLRQTCQESLTTLGPLLRSVARTGRLIDLIVHRLYCLSEEDVAVLENQVHL